LGSPGIFEESEKIKIEKSKCKIKKIPYEILYFGVLFFNFDI